VIPALNVPDHQDPIISSVGKADALNQHFCAVSASPDSRPEHVRNYLHEHRHDFAVDATTTVDEELNGNISHAELTDQLLVLARHANKAYGSDRINARMLIHGGESMRQALLFLFNKSLCQGKLPSAWKLAKVHPIGKPDKDL
jgi:hypothetical protein